MSASDVAAPWVALLGAFVGTGLVGIVARRRLVDVPNERSSHTVPTPRSGGIAITAAIVAALLVGRPFGWVSWSIATFSTVACLLGLRDDVSALRPRTKMALLLVAAALAAMPEQVKCAAAVPFVGDVHLSLLVWPLTLFWLAGYANAFNFMDGLNGMASLTAFVSATFFCFASMGDQFGRHGDDSLGEVAAVTSIAALGFLPWNFPKARIFMGDAGSLPLGLLLAWCAVRANATGALPFPASVLLLGPFLFDVTFTLVRRAIEGKTIGAAHREHLYQRLSRVWGSHAKVSLLYAGFSVVTGSLALAYAGLSDTGRLLSLVLPLAAMLGFASFVLRAERKKGS